MQNAEVIMEGHTLRLPHSVVLFGKSHPMNLHLVFEHCDLPDDNFSFKCISLTGTDDNGTNYDMSHMLENEEAPYSEMIIMSVIANKSNWDNQEKWW